MDGYTSSDDSYGGHMAGFAFEGAVSEVDPYEEEAIRYIVRPMISGPTCPSTCMKTTACRQNVSRSSQPE